MADLSQEHIISTLIEGHETTCWACGLRVLLTSNSPAFKCGWCGAITNEKVHKHESTLFWWRRLRDRCFVCVLLGFMMFVIGGGVWAVYPVVFSISYYCGILHSIITMILSISTISTFSLATFKCAGKPPSILWGSYSVVGKGHLENYTFCHYCSKPKSPRTHHCRSCGMCILDMDHHCPFIGNCVGAANHRHFIAFLMCAVVSTVYVSIMSVYAGFHVWPPLAHKSIGHSNGLSRGLALRALKKILRAFFSSAAFLSARGSAAFLSARGSAAFLSARGLVLVYLFVASVSMEIGLSVLLWQQLCYIYEGETYLNHLNSQKSGRPGKKDCQNLLRFFRCPYSLLRYLPNARNSAKGHKN